jgi:hypothetical protein
MELDFSDKIRAKILEEVGSEEEISEEAWASEKNKGKALNKPFRTSGGPKKFSVYVKNEKGNVVKVNFGDPNMEIKRDDPARRKSFRARHNCDNPGPKTKAKYWSCKMWSKKSVTKVTKGSEEEAEEALLGWLDESLSKHSGLTEKQKKLPEAIQKSILKKKGKSGDSKEDKKDPKNNKEESEKKEESDAKKGLWENIRDKKKREGKNYRPAKPGDKDYPDPKALKKAQESSKKKKDSKK